MTKIDMAKLPNYLTYARIAAIPVIVLLLLSGVPALRWLAFVLYAAAAITDFLDGWLARRYGTISPLGRMLDPIADKLLVAALLLVFAFDRTFTSWDLIPALVILLREIFVSGLREFMGDRGIVVPVSKLGKWKTAVQLLALAAFILYPLVFGMHEVAIILLWLAAVLTAMTGWQYWQSVATDLRRDEPLP